MNKTIFLFGNGKLPILILKKIKAENYDTFIIEIGDSQLPKKSVNLSNINLGKILTILKKLKKNGFNQILMAGSIKRPRLNEIKLDLNSLKLIPKFSKVLLKGGDNRLLKFVIEELENIGFKVLFLHKILPDFFLGLGSQTSQKVKKVFLDDIAKGSAILRGISKFDIGQSIVLQEGNVIGVEAAQGTDNLIKQSLPYLINVKKGVLIKLVKVNQDLRADLPTIGLKTLNHCFNCGFKGIAYSANKTIFLEKEKVLKFCIQNKFFLYGI